MMKQILCYVSMKIDLKYNYSNYRIIELCVVLDIQDDEGEETKRIHPEPRD